MLLRVLFVVISVGAVIDAAPQWGTFSGEYKLYVKIGDQVEAEYEKLHPDGSITRRVACGDINKGLIYENYKIDPEGNVLKLEGPKVYDTPADLLRPAGYSKLPRDSGVARLKPEKPLLTDVELTKNPLKDFFEDIFSL